MIEYHHNKRSGNQGDCIKHLALVSVVLDLLETSGDTFKYMDTFCGPSWNNLHPDGQWALGIQRVAESFKNPRTSSLWWWYDTYVKRMEETRKYPGSSAIVSDLVLGRKKELHLSLFDINTQVILDLQKHHQSCPVSISNIAATIEDLEAFSPDLLLIDPPGFGGQSIESPSEHELVSFLKNCENGILWLPILESEPAKECFGIFPHISVLWGKQGTRTYGCDLFMNLPNQVVENVATDLQELVGTLNWDMKVKSL